MKEYRVTPLLAQELSFVTESEVSGFSFMTQSKTVVTCSCGYHETFPPSEHNTCPKCGKKLIQFHNAPSCPDYGHYERYYCEKDGDEVTAYRIVETISYNGTADEYVGTINKVKLFTVNCKTLDLQVFQRRYTGGGVREALKIPEMNTFMMTAIIATDGYLDGDGVLSRIFDFFKDCHWTSAEIDSNIFFYALLLKFHLMGILLPYPNVEKLLSDGLHITTTRMQQIVMNNPTVLCRKGEGYIYGESFVTLEGLHDEIKKTLNAFLALEKREFPNSDFYVELIDRGVLNLSEFRKVINAYKSIKRDGTMEIEEHLNWFITQKNVEVSSRLADVFAEFVRKFYNRDINILKEFYERTEKLQHAGVPQILENYLDKGYFNVANSEKFLYSGSNFQEEFQKDPLQCLKKMK